jgi:UPF0042 nucleotide-binding protein
VRPEEFRDQDQQLNIIVYSFGFKNGTPVDANLLIDVRFLPNPYWQQQLRPKSGLQPEVSAYVLESDQGQEFLAVLTPLLLCTARQSAAAGKQELRVAVGCTGGRHRSVAVVEFLAATLRRDADWQVLTQHRDIEKDES